MAHTKTTLTLLLLLLPTLGRAQNVAVVGDIVVVKDTTGNITTPSGFPGLQGSFCRDAYNQLRTLLPDAYDGIFAFSTYDGWSTLDNVWQGTPTKVTATGIGRDMSAAGILGPYNGQKLSQCVFMGTLGTTSLIPGGGGGPASTPLPDNPADKVKSLGAFDGLTGVEMLGHEYGHHWLVGFTFDKNDGQGKRDLARGFMEGSEGNPGTPNQHYSHYANSGSVMYGNCITSLGNGSYKLDGCPRKYNQVDQYLMGLRAPNEVSPMLALVGPDGHGVDSQPLTTGASLTLNGQTAITFDADDIIRAMGPRNPAFPNAQRCWKVAFVVVLPPGQSGITANQYAKVERYRQAWQGWFNSATDGRGTMETRLMQNSCLTPADAGTPAADAGSSTPDAGSVVEEPDAGEAADAGDELQPTGDAGTDAGLDPLPGPIEPAPDDMSVTRLRPTTCGCGASGGAALGLAGLALLLRRPRRFGG